MSTLNLGVAGLGRLGRRHALNLRERIVGARVLAAVSLAAAGRTGLGAPGTARCRRPRHAGGPAGRTGLDAVLLATPTALHAEQIIACLDAGKHVFCESRWR